MYSSSSTLTENYCTMLRTSDDDEQKVCTSMM